MRIEVGEYSAKSFTVIEIHHKSEPVLRFDAGAYRTAKLSHSETDIPKEYRLTLFKEANDFIQNYLTPEQQDEMYDIYARMESLLNTDNSSVFDPATSSTRGLMRNLGALMNRLYKLVKFDDCLEAVKYNTSLKIPPELTDTYETEDKITPLYMARTYLRPEYIDLVALCLGLRFAVPVFGVYARMVSSATGSELKEYQAFRILNKTVRHWRPIERMLTYIEANMDKDVETMALSLNFLSTKEIPLYSLAKTCIRKLAVAPLSYDYPSFHLMRITYGFSITRLRQLPMTLAPNLRRKGETGVYEDDNSSVFCMFKMKEQISTGDLEITNKYISNYEQMALQLEPDLDLDKLHQCYNYVRDIQSWISEDVQKSLVSWLLSPVIAGTTVPLLNRESLRISMAVVQAILWHWDYPVLAAMVTARHAPRDRRTFSPKMGKSPIQPETMAELEALFPYKLPLTRNDSVAGGRSDNAGVRGVELINSALTTEEWSLQAPAELEALITLDSVSGMIDFPMDLREQLAQVLVRIHSITITH